MKKFETGINTEFIKLDQLLKFSGLAESGSEAKDMILCKMVSVNGEECLMRGKKIRVGDSVTIEFEDETAVIDVVNE